MLSREDNELLTQVGPGTPMGELVRRFWFPILIADELPAPDCEPVRVRVLGEYLVAWRDTSGVLGLLDARCPHRGADLSMGLSENGGLRCPRCYWKFDVAGKILDLPMEPEDSPLWHEVSAKAYKAREYGGMIWAYMGPGRRPARPARVRMDPRAPLPPLRLPLSRRVQLHAGRRGRTRRRPRGGAGAGGRARREGPDGRRARTHGTGQVDGLRSVDRHGVGRRWEGQPESPGDALADAVLHGPRPPPTRTCSRASRGSRSTTSRRWRSQ